MNGAWDKDIAEMTLLPVEKNGLQMYRNYSRSFAERGRQEFVIQVDREQHDINPLRQIVGHVSEVEPRSIPVIACAFADDQLEAMFRREIPEGVPGGKGDLLGSMGSLGRLAQRIQVAYAFNWLSPDLLLELHHFRKIRNDISHKWDLAFLESKLVDLVSNKQFAVENELVSESLLPEEFKKSMDNIQRLRLRTIWQLGRVFYEALLWPAALKAGHSPHITLYGNSPNPALLGRVTEICGQATLAMVEKK